MEGEEDLTELIRLSLECLGGPGWPLLDTFETVIEKEVIPAYFAKGSELQGVRGSRNIEARLAGDLVPFSVRHERHGMEKGLAHVSGRALWRV